VFLALVLLVLLLLLWKRGGWKRYDTVAVELPFLGGKVVIRPNYEVMQIAHKVWTELVTRKAGLEIDTENDVITEVYDSWYQLFGKIRESLAAIPAQLMRNDKDTRALVDLLVRALNQGLRPHLTRWQARFRRWYDHEVSQHPELSPQEIQQRFQQYQELLKDLRTANKELLQLAQALALIAHG
jgi:hypothetical protein